MPEVAYQDGSVLLGNELSPDNVVQILQPIVCSLLGINPPNYYLVRVEWPETGQPAWKVNEDIAFLRCVDDNADYSQRRDQQKIVVNGVTMEEITYVTAWRAFFDFYGPNCYLRASNLITGMMLQIGRNALETAGLYINPQIPRPQYLKEPRNGKWWPRASFSVLFTYLVTNRVAVETALSGEVLVYDSEGLQSDIKVSVPAAPPSWPSA